ncbi:uncharacterized protein LY89DRAFT_309916 [Mollisia scopiformis]|uniref:Uncharacterized protein n=1 Tax=Mollisia scopiformis TaxID=149040 RepID=A0A194XRH9_MOLSC|nr:uncharacterized protein LY89DRAFT_309916 [Mollisia scopiformis]KUJ22756.1 hypothetical protein LY89DRAFT_309916 [Mollisia scopiformis]
MKLDQLFLILILHTLTLSVSVSCSHIPALRTNTYHPPLLRARATTATTITSATPLQTALCGWLGGDPGQPWTCAVDGECVIATAKATNAVGCCVSGRCASFRTSCVPATAVCNSACSSNKENLICSNDAPLCATFTYPGDYTELRCVSSAPPTLQVAFTFSGFTTPLPLPRMLSTMTSCDSTGRCIPDLTIETQTPSSSKVTSTTPKTGTTKTSSSPGSTSTSGAPATSSSDTGAIVGGVVGGVAGVALIGGGLFLYYWRKKRSQRNAVMAAGSGAGVQSPYHSPQSGNAQPAERQSHHPHANGEQEVYGGVMKAELPTQFHEGGGGMGTEAVKVDEVPGPREAWEMDGVVRQDTPLMELEAHEMADRRPR